MDSDNYTEPLSKDQLLVLSYLDISTSILSVLGAGSVVLVVLFRGNITKPEIHPIFHLSLADLLASIFLVISAIFFSQDNVPVFCHICSLLSTTFFVCTFFLTITYAIQTVLNLKKQHLTHYSFHQLCDDFDDEEQLFQSRQEPRTPKRKFVVPLLYVLSWGLPLLVAVILLGRAIADGSLGKRKKVINCSSCLPLFHYREDSCWALSDNDIPPLRLALRLGFLIPLFAVLVLNSFLYVYLYHSYRANNRSRGVVGGRQHDRLRVIRNRALSFQGVFFLCWLPSLLLGLISLSSDFSMNTYYPMYILQAMTAPLQGFLNSMVYAWQRKSFVAGVAAMQTPDFVANTNRDYFTFEGPIRHN